MCHHFAPTRSGVGKSRGVVGAVWWSKLRGAPKGLVESLASVVDGDKEASGGTSWKTSDGGTREAHRIPRISLYILHAPSCPEWLHQGRGCLHTAVITAIPSLAMLGLPRIAHGSDPYLCHWQIRLRRWWRLPHRTSASVGLSAGRQTLVLLESVPIHHRLSRQKSRKL